jgi:phosphatidylinositol alpha-1,6-mannosyltransferase
MPNATLLVTSGLIPEQGGIQTVAKLAWDACRRVSPCSLVCFGPADAADQHGAVHQVVTSSKFALVGRILVGRWPAEVGLFNHVDLLKLLPFMRGGPRQVVVFLHGVEAWRPLGRLTQRLLRRVELFLSNSQHTWERFLTWQPDLAKSRHIVVPLGIAAAAPGGIPDPEPPPTGLILGRMTCGEDYKGHRELIGVWPRVRACVPGARLWIAGDGDLRSELEALAGGQEGVTFFGRVADDVKADLLARARCLLMPSRAEGFGLVYLEAMRLGRPCLVGDRDAGREVVNPPEAGLAADPADAGALQDAIVRLLTPGATWQAWSVAARRRYEASFTAAHFQGRLLDALYGPAGFAQG